MFDATSMEGKVVFLRFNSIPDIMKLVACKAKVLCAVTSAEEDFIASLLEDIIEKCEDGVAPGNGKVVLISLETDADLPEKWKYIVDIIHHPRGEETKKRKLPPPASDADEFNDAFAEYDQGNFEVVSVAPETCESSLLQAAASNEQPQHV